MKIAYKEHTAKGHHSVLTILQFGLTTANYLLVSPLILAHGRPFRSAETHADCFNSDSSHV